MAILVELTEKNVKTNKTSKIVLEMPEFAINVSLSDEQNFERLGLNSENIIFISHIDWNGLDVPTHVNNEMYRNPNVIKTLVTLSKLQEMLDADENLVKAELDAKMSLDEILTNENMYLVNVDTEEKLGKYIAKYYFPAYYEMPEEMMKYFDFKKLAKDEIASGEFIPTSYGFIGRE